MVNVASIVSDQESSLLLPVHDDDIQEQVLPMDSPGGHDSPSDSDPDYEDHDENEDFFFMMAYADFLNRLTSFKFIPLSSVKTIAEEYIAIAKKSSSFKENALRSSLLKCPNIEEEELEKIVKM